MSNWYRIVTNDYTKMPDFIDYYEKELEAARNEVKLRGYIEKNASDLPGIVENRFTQLQEIESILKYFEIQHDKLRSEKFKFFLEKYVRALTARDAEKYTDGTPEVVDMQLLINEIALLRNKYLSIMKALDQKSFMVGHITKLRCAGLDDASV